jgi:integral membrane sensor domain MASE1
MTQPRLNVQPAPGSPRPQILLGIGCIALAYFVAANLGLALRTEPEAFAVFWPPNGLLLGLLLLSDRRDRPLLMLIASGAGVSANLARGDSLAVSLGLALVNIAESCAIAWLLRRRTVSGLANANEVFLLFLVALAVCCVGAVPGAAITVVGLGAPDYAPAWLAFWLCDAMAIMLVAPLVLAWADFDWKSLQVPSRSRGFEALAGLAALACLILWGPAAGEYYLQPNAFAAVPLLLWAALRFGPRGTAAAVLAISLVGIWNTGHGRGPFANPDIPATQRLLMVQGFLSVLALSSLALAAALAERQRAQQALRESELAKASLIEELQQALAEIKTLRGFIPICAWCKKVRDDAGFWQNLEDYLRHHTEAEISHGICPICFEQETGELFPSPTP